MLPKWLIQFYSNSRFLVLIMHTNETHCALASNVSYLYPGPDIHFREFRLLGLLKGLACIPVTSRMHAQVKDGG